MTPAALLQRMAIDGIRITVTADRRIKVNGAQATVTRWLPEITLRKSALIAALCDTPPEIMDFIDDIRERAAIKEYDGNLTREQAELAALREVMQQWGVYP